MTDPRTTTQRRYRVAASRLRFSGSVRKTVEVRVDVGHERTVAILVVEGEALATFGSLDELTAAFDLTAADLEPQEASDADPDPDKA